MVKQAAISYGVILTAAGIAGFVPGITVDGMTLNLFHINGGLNVLHLLFGIAGIITGWMSYCAAKWYFAVTSANFLTLSVLGFLHGSDGYILHYLMNNPADTWLHVGCTFFALIFAWAITER